VAGVDEYIHWLSFAQQKHLEGHLFENWPHKYGAEAGNGLTDPRRKNKKNGAVPNKYKL
jgi:hypothetical protein